MVIEEFNINKGLNIFVFEDLDTEFHSHPTVEIIMAKTGDFTLWTDTETRKNLKFAIIPANQRHKLSSTNCELKIIMLEHHNKLVEDHLKIADININNGYFLQSEPNEAIIQIENLVQLISNGQILDEYDSRISKTIEYLNQNEIEYGLMIETLQEITNLSESRLSHLFKSNIGISLKKYLVWTKLKSTIKTYLNSKDDLFSALVKSGFYDHPHFSKSFKNFLGVKPTMAYSSRNVQFLPNSTH